MNDITIITAFFDIKRGNLAGFNRGNDKYLEYFKFWARIENKLIVYTDKYMAEKVSEFRSSLGLSDRTEVIIIDDFTMIEPDIYERMNVIEKNTDFINFRANPNALENKADYNLIMFLKYWCINDAVSRKAVSTELIAWMDFGFNHGGKKFINSDQFEFEWRTELDPESIHLFKSGNSPGAKPSAVFKEIQYLSQNIQGGTVILGTKRAEYFYSLIKKAMYSMLYLGLMDDDQTLLRIAYEIDPKAVIVHKSEWWFMPIKEHGAEFLTIAERKGTKKNPILAFLDILIKLKEKYKYIFRLSKEYDIIIKKENR